MKEYLFIFTKDFWRIKQHGKVQRPVINTIFAAHDYLYDNGFSWEEENGTVDIYYGKKHILRADVTDKGFTIAPHKRSIIHYHKTLQHCLSILLRGARAFQAHWELKLKINDRLAKEGKKYENSDEFLTDLHALSGGNYFDQYEFTGLSNEEKAKYTVGCYYCEKTWSVDKINFIDINSDDDDDDYDYDNTICWTGDLVPTAICPCDIDSVIISTPSMPNLKITKKLLKRMYNKYFSYLDVDDDYAVSNHIVEKTKGK